MKRGQAAEARAEQHLRDRGLQALARNYRCRHGEIDLILRDGDTLVFVEVRERRRSDFGDAAGSVTAHKQRRIIAAARHYLARHPQLAQQPIRFDVIGIDGDTGLRWLRDAFESQEY